MVTVLYSEDRIYMARNKPRFICAPCWSEAFRIYPKGNQEPVVNKYGHKFFEAAPIRGKVYFSTTWICAGLWLALANRL